MHDDRRLRGIHLWRGRLGLRRRRGLGSRCRRWRFCLVDRRERGRWRFCLVDRRGCGRGCFGLGRRGCFLFRRLREARKVVAERGARGRQVRLFLTQTCSLLHELLHLLALRDGSGDLPAAGGFHDLVRDERPRDALDAARVVGVVVAEVVLTGCGGPHGGQELALAVVGLRQRQLAERRFGGFEIRRRQRLHQARIFLGHGALDDRRCDGRLCNGRLWSGRCGFCSRLLLGRRAHTEGTECTRRDAHDGPTAQGFGTLWARGDLRHRRTRGGGGRLWGLGRGLCGRLCLSSLARSSRRHRGRLGSQGRRSDAHHRATGLHAHVLGGCDGSGQARGDRGCRGARSRPGSLERIAGLRDACCLRRCDGRDLLWRRCLPCGRVERLIERLHDVHRGGTRPAVDAHFGVGEPEDLRKARPGVRARRAFLHDAAHEQVVRQRELRHVPGFRRDLDVQGRSDLAQRAQDTGGPERQNLGDERFLASRPLGERAIGGGHRHDGLRHQVVLYGPAFGHDLGKVQVHHRGPTRDASPTQRGNARLRGLGRPGVDDQYVGTAQGDGVLRRTLLQVADDGEMLQQRFAQGKGSRLVFADEEHMQAFEVFL